MNRSLFSNEHTLKGTKTTTHYRIEGKREAFICNNCISLKRRKAWIGLLTICSIALASTFFVYVSFRFQILAINQLLFFPLMIAIFGAIGGIPASIWFLISTIWEYPSVGNEIAEETKREEYRNAGYTLWTPREYKKLK
jgi:hypothetical protein